MKYLYKQTGVVVESDVKLDSTLFTPVRREPANNTTKKTSSVTTKKTTAIRKKQV